MLIDTHCHLDAGAFTQSPAQLLAAAQAQGVSYIVIPAVSHHNFAAVQHLAHSSPHLTYALGIHPFCVPSATEADLQHLAAQLERCSTDPQLVAVGEIGLDFFVPTLTTAEMRDKQYYFYEAQLKLAQKFALPVLLHGRKAQDEIVKYIRRHQGVGGIAHAFNGSFQQAEQLITLGFALGFGGAMTFTRAKQIRRLASTIDLSHLVLETDAPDMAPAWLDPKNHPEQLNQPAELAAIAQVLAELRQTDIAHIKQETTRTALRVLPRLQQWHQRQLRKTT